MFYGLTIYISSQLSEYDYKVTGQDRNPHWRSFDRKVIPRTPSVAGMLARACSSLEKLLVTL